MDSSSSESRRNWGDMPIDLLILILNRLILLPDFIRFGIICKSWNLAKKQSPMICCLNQEAPMLLIHAPYERNLRYYSIWGDPHRLQIPYRGRCCGSSYGWLAFTEKLMDKNISVTLLNPFSGKSICLPTMKFRYFNKVKKVILSCDPGLYPDDWVAVAIVDDSKNIALTRSGKESWINDWNILFPVDSACFYQGKLYLINCKFPFVDVIHFWHYGWILTNITTSVKSLRYELDCVVNNYLVHYLVELESVLVLVYRIYLRNHSTSATNATTAWFKVRKLSDSGNNRLEWIDIDDLGMYSLFLGANESIAVYDSSSNLGNFQPNCIYYTDDFKNIGPSRTYDNLGVYNLATGLITRHYIPEHSQNPAVWISPKFGKQIARKQSEPEVKQLHCKREKKWHID